jgi:hypothetical protein
MTMRKPTGLKVVAGTDRPDRRPEVVIDLPLLETVPSAPDWLPNAHSVKEFDRLAVILFNNKLLTQGGVMALAHLCGLHGKMVQLWAAGEAPTGHMLAQYRALVNDFGLTPVAQGKVKSGGKEETGNRFSKNTKPPQK